ncbi:hypothetical protein NCCP133_30170 [Cytobacillus sp. NCCP-133]|nr:hypothetical protein NCCP133_30170 [Cytobacillus sp. NCCP-133]
MGILVYLISFSSGLNLPIGIPASILNLNVIFISILIEALPFVLIGVFIAGFIQIFITEEHIRRWIPKNKAAAVVMGCTVGALFPACECGIVPIIRRLISKGVPVYAAIGFMLTGPLINPIVIVSTYMAFGNDLKMAGLRMGLGFLIAIIIAFIVSIIFRSNHLKDSVQVIHHHSYVKKRSLIEQIWSMLTHSIDEFFDMAKYLIIGAFLASIVQVFMPAKAFLQIADDPVISLVIMMGFAYILSLCSEADAFIGASFSSIFPRPSILGFLIFGPMIDFKNSIMMLSVFRLKFVLGVLVLTASVVFITILLFQNII